jgi:hypothetical protein
VTDSPDGFACSAAFSDALGVWPVEPAALVAGLGGDGGEVGGRRDELPVDIDARRALGDQRDRRTVLEICARVVREVAWGPRHVDVLPRLALRGFFADIAGLSTLPIFHHLHDRECAASTGLDDARHGARTVFGIRIHRGIQHWLGFSYGSRTHRPTRASSLPEGSHIDRPARRERQALTTCSAIRASSRAEGREQALAGCPGGARAFAGVGNRSMVTIHGTDQGSGGVRAAREPQYAWPCSLRRRRVALNRSRD